MNCKRGFKRIILLISILVAIGVGVWIGVVTADGYKKENQHLQLLRRDSRTGKIYVLKKAEVVPAEAKDTPIPLIIINSSLVGLAGGVGSFVSVWIVYYILFYFLKWPVFHLFRWIALGFREDKKE
jgi:hypothetical protein